MSLLVSAQPVSFILTANRAAAKPFYAGALGLPIVTEDDFAVTFALAGGAAMRLTDLPGHRARDHTVLGWGVADIREAVAELKAKGVTFKVFEGFGQDDAGIWSPAGKHDAGGLVYRSRWQCVEPDAVRIAAGRPHPQSAHRPRSSTTGRTSAKPASLAASTSAPVRRSSSMWTAWPQLSQIRKMQS